MCFTEQPGVLNRPIREPLPECRVSPDIRVVACPRIFCHDVGEQHAAVTHRLHVDRVASLFENITEILLISYYYQC